MQFKDVQVGQKFVAVSGTPGSVFKKISTVSTSKETIDRLYAMALAKVMLAKTAAEFDAIINEVEVASAPFFNAEWLSEQPDPTRTQTGCYFLDNEEVTLL